MENSKTSSEVKRTDCWPFILNVIKRIFSTLGDKICSTHEFVCCHNCIEEESHYL